MICTDEQIKKFVVDELYWDSRVDASTIGVTVNDGVVTLTGTVSTYGELSAARAAAWRMQGVTNVIDNLAVNVAAPPPVDADIKSRVENIVTWDPAIDATAIKTSVVNGTVTLDGTVDAYWKKGHVESSIAALRGIVRIENKLAVVPSHSLTDEFIAKDVVKKLERDPLVNAKDITVVVNDGIVTLTGKVATWAAVGAARDDAAFTGGVISVCNELTLTA
jgi:osmotically-inducible protein OsmY